MDMDDLRQLAKEAGRCGSGNRAIRRYTSDVACAVGVHKSGSSDESRPSAKYVVLLIRRFEPKSIVTVQVLYFIPGYSLLNEFLWQTLDTRPRYPRVHSFLDYWRREIDAVIKEVTICDVGPR